MRASEEGRSKSMQQPSEDDGGATTQVRTDGVRKIIVPAILSLCTSFVDVQDDNTERTHNESEELDRFEDYSPDHFDHSLGGGGKRGGGSEVVSSPLNLLQTYSEEPPPPTPTGGAADPHRTSQTSLEAFAEPMPPPEVGGDSSYQTSSLTRRHQQHVPHHHSHHSHHHQRQEEQHPVLTRHASLERGVGPTYGFINSRPPVMRPRTGSTNSGGAGMRSSHHRFSFPDYQQMEQELEKGNAASATSSASVAKRAQPVMPFRRELPQIPSKPPSKSSVSAAPPGQSLLAQFDSGPATEDEGKDQPLPPPPPVPPHHPHHHHHTHQRHHHYAAPGPAGSAAAAPAPPRSRFPPHRPHPQQMSEIGYMDPYYYGQQQPLHDISGPPPPVPPHQSYYDYQAGHTPRPHHRYSDEPQERSQVEAESGFFEQSSRLVFSIFFR